MESSVLVVQVSDGRPSPKAQAGEDRRETLYDASDPPTMYESTKGVDMAGKMSTEATEASFYQ